MLSVNELRRGLARRIAREVRSVLSEDRGLSFGPVGATCRIKPGEVFILTAKNSEAREVSERFVKRRCRSRSTSRMGCFRPTRLARSATCWRRSTTLATVRDGRAWITPFFAIPLTALRDLADLPDSHPLVQRLTEWNELARRRRFEALFTRILDDSGLIRRELFLKDDERALTNYLHLFEILLEKREPPAANCPTW